MPRKKFTMFMAENWFKVAVLIFIVTACGMAFLYVSRQQSIEMQRQVNALESDCRKDAVKMKADIEKESRLSLSTYLYRYNSDYHACIVAYTGFYSADAPLVNVLGHGTFQIHNISTGESLLTERANPGPQYLEANLTFERLVKQYLSIDYDMGSE